MIFPLAWTHKTITFATYSQTIKANKSYTRVLECSICSALPWAMKALPTFHGNVEAGCPGKQGQEQSKLQGLRQPHHRLLVHGDTVQLASLGMCKAPAIWKSHNRKGAGGLQQVNFIQLDVRSGWWWVSMFKGTKAWPAITLGRRFNREWAPVQRRSNKPFPHHSKWARVKTTAASEWAAAIESFQELCLRPLNRNVGPTWD